MFQRMADQVAQIPVTDQDQAILATGQKLRPSLTIEVVEPLDLYEIEETSKQLRGKISTDTPVEAVQATVRVIETAAAVAPVLNSVASLSGRPPVSVNDRSPVDDSRHVNTGVATKHAPQHTQELAPARSRSRSDGGLAAQLGSYRSEADARQAWANWVAQNPALKGHSPRVEQVVRADGTRWVRLKAGPVASEAEARALCDASGVKDPWCARGVYSGRPL